MKAVKEENNIKALLWGVALLIAGCAPLGGCSKEEEPSPVPDAEEEEAAPPSWSVASESDCPEAPLWEATYPRGGDAPPEWVLPDLGVFPTSMAAVITLPSTLEPYAGAGDMLGAFIGGECRGLAEAVESEGKTLWFVVFKADDSSAQNVEFRYYSARLGRVFGADDGVRYQTNGSYGTPTDPAVPSFEKGLRLRGQVMIPSALVGYSSANDKLALFSGDECRGVGTLTNNGTYAIDAFLLPGEEFSFQYYNARLKYLFSSNADEMKEGRELGTSASPYNLDFLLSRCHPLKVNLKLRLPDSLVSGASEKDMIGVFVGDECRGVARWSPVTKVAVRASVTPESYTVRYYSASTATYYRSREALPMPAEDAGSAEEPLVPELIKEKS